MRSVKMFPAVVASALVVLGAAPGVAQIPVNNLSDDTPYTAPRTFSVPAQAGFTYEVVTLSGQPIPTDTNISLDRADYYELYIRRAPSGGGPAEERLVRFIIRASDRSNTEDGLPAWVPYPVINSSAAELAPAHFEIIVPDRYPEGMEIPVVAWLRNAAGGVVRANGLMHSPDQPSIQLRRGVGAGYLKADNPAGLLAYSAQLPGLQTNLNILIEAATSWTPVSGTLSGNVLWDENSRMAVTGNITIPNGSTLTIRDGSVIRLNAGVNVTVQGHLVVEGSPDRPVVFTPVSRSQPWGGFFLEQASSELDASGAIFVASGSRQSGFPGHRSEQPLFSVDNRGRVALTNCAAIDLAGQFHHSIELSPPYHQFVMARSLIQRCTTAGEFNGSALKFLDSALIEVPHDDQFFCDDPDCDHDGLYLNRGEFLIQDSLLGWVKDDCLDAGSGSGESMVTVSNCWFEASFHEGLAYSGSQRSTRNYDSVFINCGQGVEAGWTSSSPGGTTDPPSPDVFAERILSTGNASGVRFGDNYNWGYRGFLRVTNSLLLYNYRNIFGKTWNSPSGSGWDANSWVDRLGQMDIRNNYLSSADTNHPLNQLWDPAQDGARLAPFMSTPTDAPVGVALALWSNLLSSDQITNPIPVGLSSFTVDEVTVGYVVESDTGPIANGTVRFAPGQTIAFIPINIPDPNVYQAVGVRLLNPVNGLLTGSAAALYAQGTGGPPPGTDFLVSRGALWNYLVTPVAAPAAWNTLGFNDSSWAGGAAELGYGESDQTTTIGFGPDSNDKYPTTYFRHAFNVSTEYEGLSLWLKSDDGGVVYINRTEVFRTPNMPSGTVTYTTRTLQGQNGENTIDTAELDPGTLQNGPNVVAVEIHQADAGSSDLSFDLELVGNVPPLPPAVRLIRLSDQAWFVWEDPDYVLECSEAVSGGDWTEIPGASPMVQAMSATQKFYRLRKL